VLRFVAGFLVAAVLLTAAPAMAPANMDSVDSRSPQSVGITVETAFLCVTLTVTASGDMHTWVSVDWGDGTVNEWLELACTPVHDYTFAGEYPVVARINYLDFRGASCYERVATYQATIGVPSPVRTSTWGAIKALYRQDAD
jgi:hypothetical protein